jgi:hypothetical protein
MVGKFGLNGRTGIRAIGIYADLADVRPALFAAEKAVSEIRNCLAPVASERAPPSSSLRPSSLDVEDYVEARNSEPPAPGLAI